MTGFTKGPWVNVGGWVDAESGGIICSLSAVDMKSESVSDANAHLIAAAPELYEALDELVSYMELNGVFISSLDSAVSALAKARGETK